MKILKSHTFFDGTTLKMEKWFDGLYVVTIDDVNGLVKDSYTSFVRLQAAQVYNKWKEKLMRNHDEWWERIEDYDDDSIC
jgi:hypothetical protein